MSAGNVLKPAIETAYSGNNSSFSYKLRIECGTQESHIHDLRETFDSFNHTIQLLLNMSITNINVKNGDAFLSCRNTENCMFWG